MLKQLGSRDELIGEITTAVEARRPIQVKRRRGQSGKLPLVSVVLKLSDWHIGEVIKRDQTEGRNAYNWRVAQDRLLGVIIPNFLKWVDGNRKTYRIEEVVVSCEGDYVSGDIHEELKVTNEFPTTVATARAGDLLGETILTMAPHFAKTTVLAIGGGNHDRTTRKPIGKERVQNSWGFLVHHIAARVVDKVSTVQFVESEGMKLRWEVNGKALLIEHGDAIRGHMGIPYYGFNRLSGKEAIRRMNTEQGIDYHSIGHFHVPALIENRWIVNGSLSGTTEFDHTQGRHAEPCQVAFMVGKHGAFNLTPFGEEI